MKKEETIKDIIIFLFIIVYTILIVDINSTVDDIEEGVRDINNKVDMIESYNFDHSKIK